jgi:uncharacterized protein YndB with AHSA1/START domain
VPCRALILAALLSLPALPGEPRPTPTGEVWVEPGQGVGRGVIEAPPERVFRALADYAHWAEFMPFLEASDARPGPDGSVVSEHAMKLPSPLGERRYRVRFNRKVEMVPQGKVWRIEWAYVPGSGNVRDHRGSWTLTALGPGRTLGVCRLFTDPGDRTPRWAMDRGTDKMLPWIFHGLRQHVRRSRYDGGPAVR